MRVRNGIGIGVGLFVPVMILVEGGIKIEFPSSTTNIVNSHGNTNIAEGGGDINLAGDSVVGTTLAHGPTVSFDVTLPKGSPPESAAWSPLVTNGVFDAKLTIPTMLVEALEQDIKVTVRGCTKAGNE
jgi:hypothetical protein